MSDDTNTFTSQTATVQTDALSDPLMLIGIFGTQDAPTVLLRNRAGQISRLPDAASGLRLVGTGDGWALVEQRGTLRRLSLG